MALFDQSFLSKLENLHLLTRSIFSGQYHALAPSRKIGSGLEFADHRDYAAGDDPRQIDWLLYSRVEKLFTKLFHVEEDQSIYLLLDTSSSMAIHEAKYDYARRVVAALAFIGLANLDRVTIVTFGEELGPLLKNVRGKKAIHRVFQFLEAPGATGGTGVRTQIEGVARSFTARFRQRGVVIVASDFLDADGPSGLDALAARRFDLSLIHVVAPEEVDPPWRGVHTIVDCETGARRRVQFTRGLLRAYRHEWGEHCRRLRTYASRRRAFYAEARTDLPFEELVLSSLRAGGLLR